MNGTEVLSTLAVWSTATAATSVTAGALLAKPVLGLLGFKAAGIAAGTPAAAWMSSIAVSNGVGVAAGSVFAGLQSFGMSAGISSLCASAMPVVGASVGVGLGVVAVSKYGVVPLSKDLAQHAVWAVSKGVQVGSRLVNASYFSA